MRLYAWMKKSLALSNLKIKTKLMVTNSILICLLVAAIGTFVYYHSVRIIRDKSINYTLGILEQIRNNIDITQEQINQATYIVFSNRTVLNTLQYGKSSLIWNDPVQPVTGVERILSDFMLSRQDIESVFLLGKNHTHFGTSYPLPDFTYTELYQKAKIGDGRLVWLDVDKERELIPAVRLINNVNIQPVGVMLFNIRESSIRKVLSEQMSKMNGQVYILNRNGNIVSSSDQKLLGTRLDTRILKQIGPQEGFFINTIDKQQSIVIYYPSRFNDWKFVSVIPMHEITKDAVNTRNIIIMAGLISLLIFIPLSYLVANEIITPLHQMATLMKTARIKDWSPKIDYRGNDEIAYLSEAFNDMVLRINSLIDEVYEQKLRRNQQELKALQAQINPHFLYNTLETINWMARSKGAVEVAEIIKALSNMMRYSISYNEDITTIEKEIDHVKNYCLIQAARYGNKFQVTYQIEDEILDCNIPKLTLQPIVENAIMHGLKGKTNGGLIAIKGGIVQDNVVLTVSDNGAGMTDEQIEMAFGKGQPSNKDKHVGIGIQNVHHRICLNYGENYGLRISSKPGEGSAFEIWLPILG